MCTKGNSKNQRDFGGSVSPGQIMKGPSTHLLKAKRAHEHAGGHLFGVFFCTFPKSTSDGVLNYKMNYS